MLKTRVITALAILPIVLIALFVFPRWAWTGFALVFVGIGTWEWRRFCRMSSPVAIVYYVAMAAAMAAVSAAYLLRPFAQFADGTMWLLIAAVAFWMAIVPLWLVQIWRAPSAVIDAIAGALVLVPTLAAALLLREVSPWLLLSFAAIVWVADIAAYFSGKALGKHKLAPAISPGKTIEGVIGGLVGVAGYYALWHWLTGTWLPDASWAQVMRAQGWALLLFFLLLGGVSVIGDLFESWMKRGAGLKDSSNLLPGHGGILDRIDALTSTLPLAALFIVLAMRGV